MVTARNTGSTMNSDKGLFSLFSNLFMVENNLKHV
jgi:hypothetical protein